MDLARGNGYLVAGAARTQKVVTGPRISFPATTPNFLMHTITFHSGSVVRFRDGVTGIVLLLEERTIICTQGVLRALQASEIKENPARCVVCQQSCWYWQTDLLPKCRMCEPPSPEWQGALFGRAMAALYACRHDEAFLRGARPSIQRAFETWDLDRLLHCAGAHALREHLINRKRKDRP